VYASEYRNISKEITETAGKNAWISKTRTAKRDGKFKGT
jgi:hypothetical protein